VIFVCVVLLLLFGVSLFFAIRFGILIIRIQDALEDSLDVIDERYESITAVCERPLFYDSPEVRQVLEDIKETRTALHKIAYALSKNFEGAEDPDPVEEDGS